MAKQSTAEEKGLWPRICKRGTALFIPSNTSAEAHAPLSGDKTVAGTSPWLHFVMSHLRDYTQLQKTLSQMALQDKGEKKGAVF